MALGVGGIGLAEDLARPLHVVVNLGDQLLVLGGVLRESRELAQIVVADDDDIHAGHVGDIEGIGDTGGGLDHDDHEHVFIDGVTVVDTVNAPNGPILAAARTTPSVWWIARPLGTLASAVDVIDGGNNHSQTTDIGGVLDVPFLRVGQADHGDGAGVRAGGDHLLDIGELEGAVLHLEPGIVVMLGGLAIGGRVHLVLREAEDLLAFEQLLLGGVVKVQRFGNRRRHRLCLCRNQAQHGAHSGGQDESFDMHKSLRGFSFYFTTPGAVSLMPSTHPGYHRKMLPVRLAMKISPFWPSESQCPGLSMEPRILPV